MESLMKEMRQARNDYYQDPNSKVKKLSHFLSVQLPGLVFFLCPNLEGAVRNTCCFRREQAIEASLYITTTRGIHKAEYSPRATKRRLSTHTIPSITGTHNRSIFRI